MVKELSEPSELLLRLLSGSPAAATVQMVSALMQTSLTADERRQLGRKVTVQFDLEHAAEELGLQDLRPWFAAHVDTPAWLKQRREIKSFFIAEIDRDKVVAIGEL